MDIKIILRELIFLMRNRYVQNYKKIIYNFYGHKSNRLLLNLFIKLLQVYEVERYNPSIHIIFIKAAQNKNIIKLCYINSRRSEVNKSW